MDNKSSFWLRQTDRSNEVVATNKRELYTKKTKRKIEQKCAIYKVDNAISEDEARFLKTKLPISGASKLVKKKYVNIATKVLAWLFTVYTLGVNDVPEEVERSWARLRQSFNQLCKTEDAYDGWPRINDQRKLTKSSSRLS